MDWNCLTQNSEYEAEMVYLEHVFAEDLSQYNS
jgi:hypothetical protein